MLTVIRILLLIIGWTLLILLGLLLLLLLFLLFTPIPYRVRLNGDPDRKPVFEFSVSVFGLQLYPKKERKRRRHIKNRKKNKNQNQKKQTADISGDGLSETPEDIGITSKAAAPDSGAGQTAAEAQTPEVAADGHTEKNKRRNQKPKAKKNGNSKGTAALAGIRTVFQELSDTGNKQALQHVLREVCYILRHFGPRQVRADAAFSLGDPANTGYATAGLSLCPFAYGRHCVITPDFQSERVYFYGWAELRGHVRLIHAACAGIRLLADRQIRRLLRKLRT